MSEDSFTEVSSEGWLGRIGGSIKGVLFGIVIFLIGFPVLWFNEGSSVDRAKALEEGAGAIVSLASVESVDASKEGKLIHATGKATVEGEVRDDIFGVSAKAIKLNRVVEMYQWKEDKKSKKEKKVGGGTETRTTYNYNKQWSGSAINSSDFKKRDGHSNPPMSLQRSS